MKSWGKTSGTYTDENGQDWIINLHINYIVGGTQDFVDGDNTLDISHIRESGRSKVEGGDKMIMEQTARRYKWIGQWVYNTVGNQGTMRGGDRVLNYGFTSFYEGLHFLGLSDRYEESGYIPETYKTDMMSGSGTDMHQNQWNNWGKTILKNPNSNFILRHKVNMIGDENMKYLQPENQPTKRGTRR